MTPWAKGAQNGSEKWVFCNNGTMKLFFFVAGQIGMKFGKTSVGVLY